jgi:hypothetical protein
MSLLKKFKQKFDDYQTKRKDEEDIRRKVELEAKAEQDRIFQQEYRQNLLKKAKIQAIRDARDKSGIEKMRAINQKYASDKPKNDFFSRLSEYTKANRERREKNLRKANEMRKASAQMRNKRNDGRSSWY